VDLMKCDGADSVDVCERKVEEVIGVGFLVGENGMADFVEIWKRNVEKVVGVEFWTGEDRRADFEMDVVPSGKVRDSMEVVLDMDF